MGTQYETQYKGGETPDHISSLRPRTSSYHSSPLPTRRVNIVASLITVATETFKTGDWIESLLLLHLVTGLALCTR